MENTKERAETEIANAHILKPFSMFQLLNFCLGFFGLQFAWQMRIILSGPVTESLGASPFLFGLIWLAGPFTGMVVQPIIGALSDNTHTKFGKRRPYLLLGALLASFALVVFPNSKSIVDLIFNFLGFDAPVLGALVLAAIMIWIIDACVNVAQGPYRALIPDTMPKEQHSLANSFLSFAIGLGSVIAAGCAPVLKYLFNYQMSINAQFIMAALAFSLAMIWTCLTIKEYSSESKNKNSSDNDDSAKLSFLQKIKDFFALSPEVGKICLFQFFTWIGVMCMFIFFTQYTVHTIYNVPDMTNATEQVKAAFSQAMLDGTNLSSIGFAVFNLVCFLVSIPIGILSSKFGNKKLHIISLLSMAFAYVALACVKDIKLVMLFMAIAGIGWASILSLPFAMLSKYIKPGTEGSVMGIFNIFIAGPQVFVCTLVSAFINKTAFITQAGTNYHWEYSLFIGAVSLLLASFVTSFVKEANT